MRTYLTGTTRRSTGTDLEPLRHAVERHRPRASRTGRNYRALCDASVRDLSLETWDPDHARACRACWARAAGRERQ